MFSLYQRMRVRIDGKEGEFPVPTVLGMLALLVVVVSLWTTWFTVGKGEQAVVQRFGAYSRSEGPGGPYFKWPWPIDTATRVDVQSVLQIPIGFRMENGKAVEIPLEAEVLTGDLNTVMIDSILQYQRTDAKKWLFSAQEPERQLFFLAQAALRRAVAGATFDQILTTERPAAQTASEGRIREISGTLNLGARIIAHQIQDTHPASAVQASFKDVMNAHEDKQKFIQQGNAYRNEWIPKARGEARKLIEGATGYKNTRINEAKGAASRFEQVYAEYRRAPELTTERMRLEAIEAIMPGKAQIIDRTSGAGSAPVLKLLDIGGAAKAAKDAQK